MVCYCTVWMISHGIYIERVGFSSDFHRSISIAHLLVMGLMCSVYIEALYVKEKKLVFFLKCPLTLWAFQSIRDSTVHERKPGRWLLRTYQYRNRIVSNSCSKSHWVQRLSIRQSCLSCQGLNFYLICNFYISTGRDISPHLAFVTHLPLPHRLQRFKFQSLCAKFILCSK